MTHARVPGSNGCGYWGHSSKEISEEGSTGEQFVLPLEDASEMSPQERSRRAIEADRMNDAPGK